MGKLYYETIYRKIFNTLKYIDWNIVKRQKLLTQQQVLRVLVDEFGFNYDWIKKYNYEELCDLLINGIKESEKRKQLRDESKNLLKRDIPLLQPEILYQPGSHIVSQLTQMTKNLMVPTLEPQKNINLVYSDLYNLCSNPNSNINDIYDNAKNMGLSEIIKKQTTKKDICKTLINYIESTQTRSLF